MLTPYSAHNTYLTGIDPYLAKRGRSALLTWSAGGGSGGQVAYGYPTTTGFTQLSTGASGALPTVTTAGGVLRFTYVSSYLGTTRTYTLYYRELVNGVWRQTALAPGVAVAWTGGADPEIVPIAPVVDGSTVSVAYTTIRTGPIYVPTVSQRVNGVWSRTAVTDGQTLVKGAGAAGLGSVGGRLTLVSSHLGSVPATSSYDVARRQ